MQLLEVNLKKSSINSRFELALLDLGLVWQVVKNKVIYSNYLSLAIIFFVAILFTLQWLFNWEQLKFIFTESGLSVSSKIDVLIDALTDLFRLIDDITPVSMILIALLQSLALTLLIRLRRLKKQSQKAGAASAAGSLSIGLIASGCVACGGSLLTPILGVIASNVSVSFAERIGDILLVLAVILSYRALSRIVMVTAQTDNIGKLK